MGGQLGGDYWEECTLSLIFLILKMGIKNAPYWTDQPITTFNLTMTQASIIIYCLLRSTCHTSSGLLFNPYNLPGVTVVNSCGAVIIPAVNGKELSPERLNDLLTMPAAG